MPRGPHLSLFDPSTNSFLVPTKISSAVVRRRCQGRPLGRRATRAFLDGDEHGRTLQHVDGASRRVRSGRRVLVAALVAVLLTTTVVGPSHAQGARPEPTSLSVLVNEAEARFGVPSAWILAVIGAESGGDPRAVSPKGAMGLMQLMPGTWRDLSVQHDLGSDPFDRRANVLAGAAYLRQLFDRFGREGFLAAYNAGPARYAAALDGRRKLPVETVAYVATVERAIGPSGRSVDTPVAVDWRASDLFSGGGPTPSPSGSGGLFAPSPRPEPGR